VNLSSEQKQNELVRKWAWFLPLAYVCHVAEEAFGGHGLMEWMEAGGGVRFSLGAFLGINLIGVSLLCLAAWAARKWKIWRWPLVSGATIVLTNGIWHAALCVTTRSYVPGVWTGLFLYVPVGGFLLFRLRSLMPPWLFVCAIVFGIMIHRVTLWLVLRIPGLEL
jgi:hypothetical protein